MHNAYAAQCNSVHESGGIFKYVWKNMFPGPDDDSSSSSRSNGGESGNRPGNQAQNQPQNNPNNGAANNIWGAANDKDKRIKG